MNYKILLTLPFLLGCDYTPKEIPKQSKVDKLLTETKRMRKTLDSLYDTQLGSIIYTIEEGIKSVGKAINYTGYLDDFVDTTIYYTAEKKRGMKQFQTNFNKEFRRKINIKGKERIDVDGNFGDEFIYAINMFYTKHKERRMIANMDHHLYNIENARKFPLHRFTSN